MPATAAHEGPDEEPSLASVVELASRRSEKTFTFEEAVLDASDAELAAQATQHWGRVFAAAGIELTAPETAAVVTVVGKELERLVGGLLIIREGNEDLPADPNAGVDFASAVEMTGIVRDLVRAASRPDAGR